jgi:iron complex transport system ATP-binding protein
MNVDFPNITISLDDEALIVQSTTPLLTVSSGIVGGGVGPIQTIINMHVHKNYNGASPANDLHALALRRGVSGPFQGFMTAVYLNKAQSVTLREGDLTVTALITAGVSNATAAGLSAPAALTSGTINIILLIDANLTPAALVNAVITVSEAKTASLTAHNIRTRDDLPATGTSTDAVCIACTGRGPASDYAGPATIVGWLMARAVRQGIDAALA